jgi:BirA family biotin operon repressor/biotin-[acetyl-CoA-carboxylase] ligase
MGGHRVIRFAELDSTNRHALARLAELENGDVIQADVQTAGHGRMNRPWVSHVPGNLCLTIVVKPRHAAPASLPLANLSQLLALAVCRALDAHGVAATLKWPNDVLLGGRKIAGLLAETVVRGTEFAGMALGLGVNLNLDAATLATISQPATSLSEWTGSPVDADAFRDAVLDGFFHGRDVLLERGFSLIRDEYLTRCGFLGHPVEVRRGGETICGIAEDVDHNGALLVRTAPDRTEPVAIGEMFLLG